MTLGWHVKVENCRSPSQTEPGDSGLRCSRVGCVGAGVGVPVWSQRADLIQLRPGPSVEAQNAAGSPPTPLPPPHGAPKPRKGEAHWGLQQTSPSPHGASCLSFINGRCSGGGSARSWPYERLGWAAASLRSQVEEGEDMNNTGYILTEPAGPCRTTHLSRALPLLASELGREAFLTSRMGLTEPPDRAVLEGEALVLACGLHQLGLGAPSVRIL